MPFVFNPGSSLPSVSRIPGEDRSSYPGVPGRSRSGLGAGPPLLVPKVGFRTALFSSMLPSCQVCSRARNHRQPMLALWSALPRSVGVRRHFGRQFVLPFARVAVRMVVIEDEPRPSGSRGIDATLRNNEMGGRRGFMVKWNLCGWTMPQKDSIIS